MKLWLYSSFSKLCWFRQPTIIRSCQCNFEQ